MAVWLETIKLGDVFHNSDMSFEEVRDRVVARIRASNWEGIAFHWPDVKEAVDNLAETRDTEEFNWWWSEIYDYADQDRVWLDTFYCEAAG